MIKTNSSELDRNDTAVVFPDPEMAADTSRYEQVINTLVYPKAKENRASMVNHPVVNVPMAEIDVKVV